METNITNLYEEYAKGAIDRRSLIKRLTVLLGGTIAASSFLSVFEANYLLAAEIPNDDAKLIFEDITYPGSSGEMKAFMARPKESGKYPAVIVIHENKGLQPHIKDVTKRMAMEGFLAIAPDALSPLGGTPDNEVDLARTKMQDLDREKTVKDFTAAVAYLKTNPLTTGKVGCTGFCWGGAMTNQVAVNAPDLNAAVPYYGSQPAKEDVAKIKASILAHYAGDDARINSGIPAFEEALKEAGIEYKIYMYEGAKHAFNNDSNPERYHPEAAKLAWKRTIDFFNEKLKE